MVQLKEHLSCSATEGLNKIISIKASINLGLSYELKAAFPKIIPVLRPLVENKEIPDPY